ncbi:hypothetical protein NC651_007788 [Populus alba x Populus x berolinensis]|nr:hypothetical protein NC651_007788 [Populus alba x Populus x berolinensis]
MQMPPSGSSAINPITSLKSTAQGRSVAMSGQMIFSYFLLKTVFNLQQLVQCPGSNSQASSPPKTALSPTSYEAGEAETAAESSNPEQHWQLASSLTQPSHDSLLFSPLTGGINSGLDCPADVHSVLRPAPAAPFKFVSCIFPTAARSIVSLQGHRLPSLACAQTPASRRVAYLCTTCGSMLACSASISVPLSPAVLFSALHLLFCSC